MTSSTTSSVCSEIAGTVATASPWWPRSRSRRVPESRSVLNELSGDPELAREVQQVLKRAGGTGWRKRAQSTGKAPGRRSRGRPGPTAVVHRLGPLPVTAPRRPALQRARPWRSLEQCAFSCPRSLHEISGRVPRSGDASAMTSSPGQGGAVAPGHGRQPSAVEARGQTPLNWRQQVDATTQSRCLGPSQARRRANPRTARRLAAARASLRHLRSEHQTVCKFRSSWLWTQSFSTYT
jgi:hypothetical protein